MKKEKKVEVIGARQLTNKGVKKVPKKTVDAAIKKMGKKLAVIHMEDDGKTISGDVKGIPEKVFGLFVAIARDPFLRDIMMRACAIQTISDIGRKEVTGKPVTKKKKK